MWFRLSGGGSSGGGGGTSAGSGADSTDDTSPTLSSNHTLTVPSSTGGSEPSRFEKFRRASFRRKSTGQMATRKRTKSPHFILQADKSTSLEEADEDAEKERSAESAQERLTPTDNTPTKAMNICAGSTQSLHRSDVNILLNGLEGETRTMFVLSDPKPEHKKATLKSIKTDPPKRKFYKHFTSSTARRQGSLESAELPPAVSALATLGEFTPKSALKQRSVTAATAACKYSDDEDYDDDLDTDSTDTNDESSDVDANTDNLSPKRGNGKEKKILLTDPKYKHNRIEKSSSKTKMTDLEKRESLKRSRSARKLAAAERAAASAVAKAGASAMPSAEEAAISPPKNKDKRAEKEASKKYSRGHNNLNLHALVKFVMSNKKFLNSEEFTLTRRKSISETATSVITVAATCKPMPIALKYAPENVIADAPKEYDGKAEHNVVLVKKQNLKNSFCDHLHNNNNNECHSHDECMQLSDKDKKKKLKKQKKKSVEVEESASREIYKYIAEEDTQKALDSKVKRNSSNSSKSSKSSGNFEDEAFYSCDELEREERARGSRGGGVGGANSRGGSVSGVETSHNSNTSGSISSTSNTLSPTIFVTTDETGTQTTTSTIIKRKTSSPSLTSRVAAKINEKTNNYRNRRAVAAAAAAAATKAAKKQRKGQVSLTTAIGGVAVAAGAGAGKRAEYYKQLSGGEKMLGNYWFQESREKYRKNNSSFHINLRIACYYIWLVLPRF